MEAAARLCGVVAGEDVMAGRTRASEKRKKKEIRQEVALVPRKG